MHTWPEFQENLLKNGLQNEDFALGRQRVCQKYTFFAQIFRLLLFSAYFFWLLGMLNTSPKK
jgi:hypothetical protein